MSEFITWWRAMRALLASTLFFAGSLIAIALCPKPVGYASPGRLLLVVALFALPATALIVLPAMTRKVSENWLRFAYHNSSAIQQDSLQLLFEERRLARRGLRLTLLVSVLSTAAYVLSWWPGFSALAGARQSLSLLAYGSLIFFFLLPLAHRRNFQNARYLSRTLKLQAERSGFRRKSLFDGVRLWVTLLGRVAGHSSTDYALPPLGKLPVSLADLIKSLLIFGEPGSGKTIAFMNPILHFLLITKINGYNVAGLIVDIKSEYLRPWKKGESVPRIAKIAEACGRKNHLVMFGPGYPARCNILANSLPAFELAASFVQSAKLAGLEIREQFFSDNAEFIMGCGITVQRAISNDENPPSIVELLNFIMEPVNPKQRGPILQRMIDEVDARWPTDEEIPQDVFESLSYIEKTWRLMPDKQQSGIASTALQILKDLTAEPMRSLVTGPSTFEMGKLLNEEGLLYLAFDANVYPKLSVRAAAHFKMDAQTEIRKRLRPPNYTMLIADEYSNFYNASQDDRGDSTFISLSRECHHINVLAIQNKSSLLKKTRNKDDVTNLLGVCCTKVFLRNSDTDTNEYASRLFGEKQQLHISRSEQAISIDPLTRSRTNYSTSGKSMRLVPPEIFTQLQVPDQSNPQQLYTQAIIHRVDRQPGDHEPTYWKVHPL